MKAITLYQPWATLTSGISRGTSQMISKLLESVGDWLGKEDSELEKTVIYTVLSLIALMLIGEIIRGCLM